MTKRILWLVGRSPKWAGFVEGLGEGAVSVDSVDLTSMRDIRSAVASEKPAAVIYAGWRDEELATNSPDEAFRWNAEVPISIAAASLEFNAVSVLISTSAVFDGMKRWRESDVPCPSDTFGELFERGEKFLSRASKQSLIVRAGHVVSCDFGCEIETIRSQSKIPAHTETPILDRDLGRVIRYCIDNDLTGIIHAASSQPISLLELYRYIADESGLDKYLIYKSDKVRGSHRSLAMERVSGSKLDIQPFSEWQISNAASSSNVSPVLQEDDTSRSERPASIRGSSFIQQNSDIQLLWQGEPPAGCTEIFRGSGWGVFVWRLAPGQAVTSKRGGCEFTVRTGKLLLELGTTPKKDIVLNAGCKTKVAVGVSVRAVAVSQTELWLLNLS